MSHLQIPDALHRASPGTLLGSPNDSEVASQLRALVGPEAARDILQWAGHVGIRRMTAEEVVEAALSA